MATVINRNTLEILRSVNTPDYPLADYIINPFNLDVVAAIPRKYRKLVANTNPNDTEVSMVVEMDAGEKVSVDGAEKVLEWDSKEANIERDEFKAVVAAIVKTVNLRLPSNKITAAEMKAAIREELEKQ